MRIDAFLSEREQISRTRAQNLIKTGGVSVDGVAIDKPSLEVSGREQITVVDTLKYASLGGLKLENALLTLGVSVEEQKCIDIGAANGGFTDCLLKKGAKAVCAVDLNVAFPEELRHDPRIRIYAGVNVKDLLSVLGEERFDFIGVDLSFISLCPLFPIFSSLLEKNGKLVALFKPQFEVGRKALPKSGVVRDKKAIQKAFDRFLAFASESGLRTVGHCLVPAIFPDKNKEVTVLFEKIQ